MSGVQILICWLKCSHHCLLHMCMCEGIDTKDNAVRESLLDFLQICYLFHAKIQ